MPDQKITALTSTTTPVSTDILPIVIDPGGTPLNRKVTVASLFANASKIAIANGTITTDNPPLVITETRNAAGITFNGIRYTITDTASASASLAFQLLGGAAGSTNLFSVNKAGSVVAGAAIQTGNGSPLNFGAALSCFYGTASAIVGGNTGLTGLQNFVLGGTVPAVIGAVPAQAQSIAILQCMELLTIAAAATTTTTMQVPAGAVVFGISVRVTTVIPTAATFNVSIGASGNFNTVAVPVAATTTDRGTALGPKYIPTAAGVTITPNLTPGAATGVVRITVAYYVNTPPTS